MLKVNRKSEYALMTVQHLGGMPEGTQVAALQLADELGVPEDLLAKVLQGLKRAGVLKASKGSGGGYRLARPLGQLRFLEVIAPFEEHLAMVSCCEAPERLSESAVCERFGSCGVREPISALNQLIQLQMADLTMERFLAGRAILQASAEAEVAI